MSETTGFFWIDPPQNSCKNRSVPCRSGFKARENPLSSRFQLIEREEGSVEGFRNPDVEVPTENTAGYHQDHAPECDGHQAAYSEGGMKEDQKRPKGAKKDMNLEPVLELTNLLKPVPSVFVWNREALQKS